MAFVGSRGSCGGFPLLFCEAAEAVLITAYAALAALEPMDDGAHTACAIQTELAPIWPRPETFHVAGRTARQETAIPPTT